MQLVETLGVKFISNSYQVVQKKNRFLSYNIMFSLCIVHVPSWF